MFYLIIYIIIILFTIVESIFHENEKIKLSSIFFYFSVFCLFLIAAYRFETGGDWPGYYKIYSNKNNTVLELGFSIIIFLARIIGNYQYIFVITEAIRFIILIYILNSLKKNRLFFVLLYYSIYYFNFDFVIIRQALSISIFILYFFLKNNKNIFTFFLWCIFCSMFHFSAIGLFFFYPLLFKIKIKNLYLISLLFLILFFLKLNIIDLFIFKIIDLFPENYITSRLKAYLTVSFLSYNRVLTGRSFFFIFNYLLSMYVVFKKKIPISEIYIKGINIFIIIYFGFSAYFIISERMAAYFGLFHILFLCELKLNKSSFSRYIIIFMIIFSLGINRNLYLERPEKAAYNPYQFYYINRIIGKRSDGMNRLNITRKINIENVGDRNE